MAEEGAPTRQRKLRNVCTASDYDELRKAYRFVPEPPSHNGSGWQQRMARNYEAHLYREFVLADLTRYQTGQIGLRWRTKDEVCSGKGFDTCGNKHCPSYRSPDGSSSRDIEAARRASLSRPSEESVRRYYLDIQERKEKAVDRPSKESSKHGAKGALDKEEAEMIALSQLTYGCGLSDYEVPFTYVEQDISKTELVKLRLCLRCAPKLFHGRGGSLGAKRAREQSQMNDEQKIIASKTKQEKHEDDEDASSDSSQRSYSSSSSTGEDRRRKRRNEKSRKKKKDKRRRSDMERKHEGGERRRKRKSRRKGRRKHSREDSGDISIEGKRAEEGLLASLAESNRS